MVEPEDALIGLTDVIRRTLRTRTADTLLIEDLTQETIVKVAGRSGELADDALRAYAVVTARNSLADHHRRVATARRHAHRLVDYRSLAGPEELTLDREETNALASALDRLPEEDRALLVDHESEGVPLDVLAARHGTTTRAMAMRLARLRATLRVEFVLALRRIDKLPSLCRSVLVALSAGDARRQHELGAADHLRSCRTCAHLSTPIVQRRRGIAGWIIVPIGEGLRRAWRSLRTNHVTQAASVTLVAVATSVSVMAVRSDDHDLASTPIQRPVTTDVATTLPSSPTIEVIAPDADVVAPEAPAPPPASTAAAEGDPCAAPTDSQPPADGCAVALTGATVTEVPADEGFWIETADAQPAWVHLVGAAESPTQIIAGQRLDFTATVRAIGDPALAGIPAEQLQRLQDRGFYLEVGYDAVTIVA